ncbi:hypothetical protein BXZ70DRAFT_912325 [Cristinia sonorae]|uniref:4a-hydroxytetrahydrobiopterin dehydratase n=1 Tax=Cristinia sonorae TaxID=1940300 RepID=A0A8K0UXZ4_9AGAR|nr:hypothetical protein BXZ70DRAFT_912325 [Cristinia sonorae]
MQGIGLRTLQRGVASGRTASMFPRRNGFKFARGPAAAAAVLSRSKSGGVLDVYASGDSIKTVRDLPPLPKAPKYPCPHLTDEEVVQYLEPLYNLSWYLGVRAMKWNGQIRIPLVLAKKMDFLTFDDALKFTNELSEIVKTEKHHPQINIAPSGRLSLELDTHTATIPGVCPPNKDDPLHIYPGVTLRDVRLAILAEQLWDKYRNELKLAKDVQFEPNPTRKLQSVRKNADYRKLGFFRPPSFGDDMWRNVKFEILAYMLSEEINTR